jgi:hypothetical protein
MATATIPESVPAAGDPVGAVGVGVIEPTEAKVPEGERGL